jgi:hypothetical protein
VISNSAAPRRRLGRRAKIGAFVLAVLLVAGVVGAVIARNAAGSDEDAALAAVRAYVDAIARGDASGANNMVDPAHIGGNGVDPALLTDEVLQSARQRIKVEDVHVGSSTASAAVVAVQVVYRLGPERSTVTLRAQRYLTTADGWRWRVIDPLLVPVVIETNEPDTATATLGAATVPVSGPETTGWPEHRFVVYPAGYELRGHASRYLRASSTPPWVPAMNTDYDARPAYFATPARAALSYRDTPELTDAVDVRLVQHVTACFAAVPRVPSNCPSELSRVQDRAGITLDRMPRVESIKSYPVEYRNGDATGPSLRFVAGDGQFSYTLDDGGLRQEPLDVYGGIVVDPDDHLTVTFTAELQ